MHVDVLPPGGQKYSANSQQLLLIVKICPSKIESGVEGPGARKEELGQGRVHARPPMYPFS